MRETQKTVLPTASWQLDTAATTVTISVTKMGFFNIPATLTVLSGTIEIDENNNVSSVEVVVDAASYASKNKKRNEHVASGDFLDAAQHPTISFRTEDVHPTSGGYRSTGTVTVKGKTSPLAVDIGNVSVSDSSGSFTGTATVDRKAIGVDKLPTFVISQDLALTADAKVLKTS